MSQAAPVSATALLHRLLARGKFRHVQVLLQLAELGSVQRTADAIGMTQSSVTQTLAYLENLLEVPLFERHARGVRPTPTCTDLLPVARQLMMGVMDGAELVAARRQQGAGVVRLVGSAAAVNGLLVNALPAFHERQPRIQVQLREAEGEDQLLAIARGEVDLVACRQPAVLPAGWEFHALRSDRLAVVARAGHSLAGRGPLGRAELAAATWLLLPTGLAARSRFDELWGDGSLPATYPLVTRSLALLVHLLRNRDLLALLPLHLVRPQLENGELVELPLQEGPAALAPLGVLLPAGGMGPAACALAEFLRGEGRAHGPGALQEAVIPVETGTQGSRTQGSPGFPPSRE